MGKIVHRSGSCSYRSMIARNSFEGAAGSSSFSGGAIPPHGGPPDFVMERLLTPVTGRASDLSRVCLCVADTRAGTVVYTVCCGSSSRRRRPATGTELRVRSLYISYWAYCTMNSTYGLLFSGATHQCRRPTHHIGQACRCSLESQGTYLPSHKPESCPRRCPDPVSREDGSVHLVEASEPYTRPRRFGGSVSNPLLRLCE